MKQRPILFSGPMVNAILDGRKTQTRRVVNAVHGVGRVSEFQRSDTPGYDFIMRDRRMLWNDLRREDLLARCPYGLPGDRLWVRERIMVRPKRSVKDMREGADTWPRCVYMADGWWYGRKIDLAYAVPADYNAENEKEVWRECGFTAVPSIHMPRWASRITLEVTGVRVERLQDIRETDALDEGITYNDIPNNGLDPQRARTWFRGLWESINGAGSWEDNPWVWVLEFHRI